MSQTVVTPNQVVAFNLRRARGLYRWTQTQAAEALERHTGERWSKATFSVAERSFHHSDRIRQFTSDDVVAFAATFRLPIAFFFTPPTSVAAIGSPKAREHLSRQELVALTERPIADAVAEIADESVRRLRESFEQHGVDINMQEPKNRRQED